MDVQGVILLVVIGVVIWFTVAYSIGVNRREIATNLEREIRSIVDFSADDVYVSPYSRHGLAIDNARGLVMLIDAKRRRTVSFEKLVSAEVVQDNVTLMTTKKGLGGVVVGGLLAGGVGAIVGGLTGRQKTKSSTGVRSVALVVIVDDCNAPRHIVTFLKWPVEEGLSRNSALYRQSVEKAELWQSRLTLAMRHAERFEHTPSRAPTGGQFAQPPSALASAPTALTTQQTAAKPSFNLTGQRYRIVKLLGGGAMKKVYLAEDSRLAGRQCAVAEMLDNYSNPEEQQHAAVAFQRECDLLAMLDNQHIPKIYDHFSEDHRHYLVMEYVEGLTLEEMLSSTGGSLGENALVDLARQILDTLSYLHGLTPSVIYRDLKPSNIMITSNGRIKLVDFGIARNFEPSRTATMIGTQGYAAPEQYSGRAEPRSDIYGLGAVMHHAITGRDPTSEAPFSFPSVGQLRPDVRPALAALIDQALSYEPQKRPGSAEEMRVRLVNLALEIDSENALRTMSARLISVEQTLPPKASLTARILNFCTNCGAKLVRGDGACANCGTMVRSKDAEVPLPDEASHQTKGPNLSANEVLVSDSKGEQRSDLAFYLVVLLLGGGALAFFLVWIATSRTSAPDRPDGVSTIDVSATRAWIEPEMSEAEKAAAEEKLLAQVRSIPATDSDANLKLYQRLAALRPYKQLYKQKVAHYGRLVGIEGQTASPSSSPRVDSSATTTDEFAYNDIDHGLAAICTVMILNRGESGAELVEETKGLVCRRYKICGERSRKLLRATAEHFGGWDEVAEKCEEVR
jgi:serine/threonine protein kinase